MFSCPILKDLASSQMKVHKLWETTAIFTIGDYEQNFQVIITRQKVWQCHCVAIPVILKQGATAILGKVS